MRRIGHHTRDLASFPNSIRTTSGFAIHSSLSVADVDFLNGYRTHFSILTTLLVAVLVYGITARSTNGFLDGCDQGRGDTERSYTAPQELGDVRRATSQLPTYG